MSTSIQQSADVVGDGAWAPRRLVESTYEQAEPAQRLSLKILAAEIEVEREHQRVQLGKARKWPGGFPPASLDQVDRLSWEELLLRHPIGILDRCGKRGLKASDLLPLVQAWCAPSNPDAIFWMLERYRALEGIEPIAVNVTLQATTALRSHMGKREKAKRSKQARDAADGRHSKPGGARDMKKKITAAWAAGNFTTRELCAAEEYEHAGYKSEATARRALQGTADPVPWPANSAK